MTSLPSLFISHGSPDLLLQHTSPTLDFLRQLGKQLEKPKAILVISAHWLSQIPTVSTTSAPKTIHDFGGFPPELYQLNYPAPGAPDLAERVAKLLSAAGINCEEDPNRGLDHGAWEPLMLMYPGADIPVTQLTIQPHLGTAHHLRLGRALAPLRQEGVLILASGAVTHNLRYFGRYPLDAPAPDWVTEFDHWLSGAICTPQGLGDRPNFDALLDYRRLAPHAVQNHPSEEHLLPLFVAAGAGGKTAKGRQIHSHYTYGIFSMASYAFAE